MATKIGSLVLDMRANTTKFIQGVSKSKKSVGSLNRGIGKLTGALAILGGGGALGLVIKRSLDAADAVGKAADTVGLGVESYQEFAFAAEQAGIDQSQFTSNMTAFVKRVGEAKAGMGPLVSGLKNIDSELLETIKSTTSQEQALGLMADAIKNASSETERAALANAAFSRAGVAMTVFLRDGQEGLTAMAKQAQDLGIILSDDMVRGAEAANDRLSQLSQVVSLKFTKAIVDNAAAIDTLATAGINAINYIGGLVTELNNLENFGKFLFQQGAVDELESKIEASQRRIEVANRMFLKQQRFFETDSRKERQKSELEAEVSILNNLNMQLKTQQGLLDHVLTRRDAVNDIEETNKKMAERTTVFDGPAFGSDTETESLKSFADRLNEERALIIENEQSISDEITAFTKKRSDEEDDAARKSHRLLVGRLGAAASILGSVSGLMKKEGEKQSKTQKFLAKTAIGVSTAQAVMNALAVPPYPLGVSLAVAAGLEGQKQLSKVGGGGGATSVGALTQGTTGVDLGITGPNGTQQAPQKTTQITFIGDNYEGSGFSERIEEILKDAVNDRDIVFIDSDSRQAQEIREAS